MRNVWVIHFVSASVYFTDFGNAHGSNVQPIAVCGRFFSWYALQRDWMRVCVFDDDSDESLRMMFPLENTTSHLVLACGVCECEHSLKSKQQVVIFYVLHIYYIQSTYVCMCLKRLTQHNTHTETHNEAC